MCKVCTQSLILSDGQFEQHLIGGCGVREALIWLKMHSWLLKFLCNMSFLLEGLQ